MGSRRKIRMDHGDTLGGTVPLLLSDRVQAGSGHRGFGRRRRERTGLKTWLLTFLLAIAIGLGIVYFLVGADIVGSWAQGVWDRVVGFFYVPPKGS